MTRFSIGVRDLCILCSVETVSGAHLAYYKNSRLGYSDGRSLPSSAEVKNDLSCLYPYMLLWYAQGQLYICVFRNLNRHVGADDDMGLKTTDV